MRGEILKPVPTTYKLLIRTIIQPLIFSLQRQVNMAELTTADNNNSKLELQSKLFNEDERMKSLLVAYQSLEKKLELSSNEEQQSKVKDEQLSLEFDSGKLELVLKNTKEMDEYHNEIQQLTTKLSNASIGLKETLLRQIINSYELYQSLEEKLKLAEAEIGRLKKENFLLTLSSTSDLSKETLERIDTIQQQIGEKLNDVDGYDYNKTFQELLLALVSVACKGKELVNEFLATQELFLSSIDRTGCHDKELYNQSRARHEKFKMKIVRMREEGQ